MSEEHALLEPLLKALEDVQATDLKVIDVRKQTAITDYMILVSGRGSRHVKAVAEKVIEDMKKKGLVFMSCTGLENGDWVLIDFGVFIVHVMQPETRQFYNLEGLWYEAEPHNGD